MTHSGRDPAWERTIEIGGCTITVTSQSQDCADDIRSILALYPRSEESPDIVFDIQHNKQLELSVNGELLWKSEIPGEVTAAFEVHFYTRVVEQITPDLTSIHAAAVGLPSGAGLAACLFAGVSDAGKSSVCTKAVLEGASYLSDEFSLLSGSGDIHPFPRPLQWGKEEHPAFTHQMMEQAGIGKASFTFPNTEGTILKSLLWLPNNVQQVPLPLKYVVFPRYDASAIEPEITSIRRGEALMELPGHLHLQQRSDIMLQTLNQRIPVQTNFYRFRFADIHAGWGKLMRVFEDETS